MASNFVAQDSVRLTIDECDQIFLQRNAIVLAEQYRLSAREASVIQARMYPNPMVSADVNLYDPQNNKWFHIDSSGQKAFQVEQVILLGGKRKNDIDIAKTNFELAEAEYADLLRNLRFELHRCFYAINSHQKVINNYTRQLAILDTIIISYKVQSDKGNLPLKDLIRLKAVYIKINSGKAQLSSELFEVQKKIKLLLRFKSDVYPLIEEGHFNKYLQQKTLPELQDIALQYSPEIKIGDLNYKLAHLFLNRERKKLTPDLAVSASYDQRGGAFHNQLNMGVAMPVPLLNNNRGNIRAAEFETKAMQLFVEDKKLEIELEVQQAFRNLMGTSNEYRKVMDYYNDEFTEVLEGINDNFHRRNVTILEFVDFVESYNESFSESEKIKRKLAETAAYINYITASTIY